MKFRIALWILGLGISASAQTFPYSWLSTGAGATSVANNRWELTGGLSAGTVYGKHLFGARALFSEEFRLFTTSLKTNEFAVYYGRYRMNERGNAFAACAAGLSYEIFYTWGDRYYPAGSWLGSYYELVPNRTAGLALDLQTGVNCGRYFSIGIHGFASINPQRTIAGAMLSLRVGYLTDHRIGE